MNCNHGRSSRFTINCNSFACGAWAQHGREVKTSKTSQSSKSFQSSTSTIPKGIARAASSDVISSSVSSSYSRVDLASATANKKQQAMERQKKIAETHKNQRLLVVGGDTFYNVNGLVHRPYYLCVILRVEETMVVGQQEVP